MIKKYLIIVNLLWITEQVWCLETSDRLLSPYNAIPGYQNEDWSKSPDFGTIYFESNFPIKELKFDRIEPSEKVDKFSWQYNPIVLPYGSYDISVIPSNKYFKSLDTMIVVERQISKIINFNLKLKPSIILSYNSYNYFAAFSITSIIYGIYNVIGIQLREESSTAVSDRAIISYLVYVYILESISERYLEKIRVHNNFKNSLLTPNNGEPRPLTPVRPMYPEIAYEAGIEGVVVVQAFIDKKGKVKDTIILKGIPNTGLDEAAMEAIRKTRFLPAKKENIPVGVWIDIPVNFKLKENY